ncbi:HpcH/HpaI aldolase/citrate lyase family protein, partial [Brevibacillus sp. SYSU BS000544]|uniref:HpcH/HpaI aldolase/citrate lyase family protein n=1 Tax=Brevibacillus sp. SYSU BS000544 TaxID=3416443 RepID=UPI003CE51102
LLDTKLYGMPILEHSSIIFKETRIDSLVAIKEILDRYQDYVLNVRIGATDFSSLFGLRRSPSVTIYDLTVIRDCISDIVNMFNRKDHGYVISGPVWEYFNSSSSWKSRTNQLTRATHEEGLVREILFDKENGLIGKTIIHPSQIRPVQSLYVVSHEEYTDACSIIAKNDGEIGVVNSQYGNKMNEIKPHQNWAEKILLRAKIYGVYHEQNNFTNLLFEKAHV